MPGSRVFSAKKTSFFLWDGEEVYVLKGLIVCLGSRVFSAAEYSIEQPKKKKSSMS
jgi:hypothetical protein